MKKSGEVLSGEDQRAEVRGAHYRETMADIALMLRYTRARGVALPEALSEKVSRLLGEPPRTPPEGSPSGIPAAPGEADWVRVAE